MISIVVPVLNEQESLMAFYKVLLSTIRILKEKYEIIFVDDGSTDKSLELLKELARENENIKIFSFRKNQGKADALNLGFSKAKGDYIVTLDADLQDKPSEIKKLLDKLQEGWDMVSGWRKKRSDSAFKIITSKMFNNLASILWGLQLHDYNCGLKAYKKEAAQSVSLYGGMHRFIPLLVFDQGFKVTEVVIEHDKRKFGKSKYGISKVLTELPDIFTMLFLTRYSKRPLHFFGMVGGGLFSVGIIILSYLSYLHFLGETIGRRPLLFLGMLLVLAGIQIFFTGFLADLVINIENKKNREFNIKYSSE